VLLVGEDAGVRALIARILERAGCALVTAANGTEALSLAETEAPFDLMVTDVKMPGLSGDQVAECLRKRQPGLSVLFLAGCIDDLAHHGELASDDILLQKPIRRRDLLQAVAQSCARPAQGGMYVK
jgi:CheY-like chemotaxis protein